MPGSGSEEEAQGPLSVPTPSPHPLPRATSPCCLTAGIFIAGMIRGFQAAGSLGEYSEHTQSPAKGAQAMDKAHPKALQHPQLLCLLLSLTILPKKKPKKLKNPKFSPVAGLWHIATHPCSQTTILNKKVFNPFLNKYLFSP